MSAFDIGQDVLHQGMRMRVVDAPYNGMVTICDAGNASILHQVSLKDVAVAPLAVPQVSSIDPIAWNGAERCATAARDIIAARTVAERQARYEKHALELGCAKRTLQRAVRRIRQFDAVSVLLPRRGGRPTGVRLLAPAVEEIIAHQLEKQWLVENKPNLSDIIDQIESACRDEGLAIPCKATIRKRADALDAYHTMCLREGAKKAEYTYKPMVGHIHAALALETVQIDHTLADVMLVSSMDRTVSIGRPWVTLAVDVATRMVVGVYVSLESPSAVSVAMCLVNALLPKDEFLASLGIQGNWPVSGVMQTIHMDNGRDFHSEALQRGCSQLGIDTQYRPVGSPHYGGIIERLIGTFMGRCRLLPGTTQSNVVKKGDYDAEGEAALTLREFTAFLVNEIVNIYHVKEHRTLEMSPLQKWGELQKQPSLSMALPAGWERWMLPTTFFPYESRLVRRTGIQMFNRSYWAEGLEDWIGDGVQRAVSYDPGELTKVYIVGPKGDVLVAHDTREDARAMSLQEYRWHQKYKRILSRSDGSIEQLDQGLNTRQDFIKKATNATRKEHRQAAIAKGKQRRAADVPVPQETAQPQSQKAGASIDFSTPAFPLPARRKGA
ncbi:MAG: transposase [Rhodanobacter sp.]|nr:MAG: transposase [Rhodanobacter sp.]